MSGVRIGEVTHYFDKVSVAVLSLTDTLLYHLCQLYQKQVHNHTS